MSSDPASMASASESYRELQPPFHQGPSLEEGSQVSVCVSHRKQKHSKGEGGKGSGVPRRHLRNATGIGVI